MYELYPFVTNDGSAGLFNPSDDDIYHSVQGAATEAYEKFILPANFDEFLKTHNSLRVLDICYGIGYNTKSFLNFILQNKLKNFPKNDEGSIKILSPYNDKIYTNNNLPLNSKYNSAIYDDNISDKTQNLFIDNTHDNELENKFKIYIKAIDTDKMLAALSPFFNSKINKKLVYQFKNDKISKFSNVTLKSNNIVANNTLKIDDSCKLLEKSQLAKLYTDISPAVNLFLYERIIEQHPDILLDNEFWELLSNKKYKGYFSKKLITLFKFNRFTRCPNTPLRVLCPFLHNIYYRNISMRYKNELEAFNTLDINFDLKISDARLALKEDTSQYDFVFLDAFTPSKVPCLWSLDFFKLIYKHLSEDGVVLTYSNAAPVRNAFLNAGFYVGKIFNHSEKKFTGTIAAKNKSLIYYELSEFDLGLLKTKAGIFYRDENLDGLNEAIIERRNLEVKNSNLISCTKFKSQFNKNANLVI